MNFQLLAQHLHETANEAKSYFATKHGAKQFKAEVPLAEVTSLRPTLSGQLGDRSLICIEVSESAYSASLDTFVVDCSTKSLPVKLYVAIPDARGDPDFSNNLKRAKARGVGIVEIKNPAPILLQDAVSLSLFGVRPIDLKAYAAGRKDALRQAEATFRNGNPVKGCQSVCEELEALTRAFAKRTKAEGWWKTPAPGSAKPPAVNLDTGPWAKVLEALAASLDVTSARKKCPAFSLGLITKARALTDIRNMTSHRPASLRELIQRDTKLRTAFENACDVLADWSTATKPLKI